MSILRERIKQSIKIKQRILDDQNLLEKIKQVADLTVRSLENGGKVLFSGNGGSAGDAQHLAAELSGRFYIDREPLYAEALHTNTSYITAVANDYSYDVIYARLVRAMGKKGDVFFGISTSGNSKNIINALIEAKNKSMHTIALTGETGGDMAKYAEILINVPSTDTPRIQEAHITIGHIICELVENKYFSL